MAYSRNFNSEYTGTATTLSSSYYMRSFYVANRDAGAASKRAGFDANRLSIADGMALRRAARQLRNFSYDREQDSSIRNSVQAYIDTYNNTISSVSETTDSNMEHLGKQLKSLTSSYAGELDKIGITVNKDGTLETRDPLFKTSDISKFEKLFSGESDYMQRTTAFAKRIQNRSEALFQSKTHRQILSASAPDASAPDSGNTTPPAESGTQPDATAAAQIVARSLDLDTLLNTGIGANINLSL